MIKTIIRNFLQSPISFPVLVFKKLFIYPFKYKTKEGYDAQRYWDERLKKHGKGLKGAGEEGRNEADNSARYERACKIFKDLCLQSLNDFTKIRVLEIGVGTGQMTKVLYDLGVMNYDGIDITDALFTDLTLQFSDRKYIFSRADITRESIIKQYDLVVIIDVIEHIVEEEKFLFTMNNIKNCLTERGMMIIAPIVQKNRKIQFYERYWSHEDLEKVFPKTSIRNVTTWENDFSEIKVVCKS